LVLVDKIGAPLNQLKDSLDSSIKIETHEFDFESCTDHT